MIKSFSGSIDTCKKGAISITFGDQAENHVGMQKIGVGVDEGFTLEDFYKCEEIVYEEGGYECEILHLNSILNEEELETIGEVEDAYVLIIRNYVKGNEMYDENVNLNFDKKVWMRGSVKNKHARWNLCYDETSQEPDYENKKGRIVAFKDVPVLNGFRNKLHKILGEKARNLCAESNYYYDVKSTGIGFHGDTERKIVICVRLGESIPLHYQWFIKGKPIGDRIALQLNSGDVYIMSDKAVGHDWKKRNIATLRHAAGCYKYTLSNEEILDKI